ncbi:Blp family class II bacteriocin [Streptococcus agalactiae]|uniref:Blp family class II bacteriocin n=1 Tax=Streptococcus agalactiae TaxID=1311 RepID=UPI003C76DEB3
MNTQTISQFELLDTELLATIEGGACSWNGAGGATLQAAIGGAIGGAFGGNMVLPVVGSVPGYLGGGILGGAGGAVGYGATCWWIK